MIARLFRDKRAEAILRRIDRPEAVALAVGLALLTAVGWLVTPLGLAVVIAFQLGIGGFAAAYLIGPSRPGLGYSRYATLALAAMAITLGGRLIPGGVSLLLVPIVAILLWSVLWLELRASREIGSKTALDLALVAIVFAGAAGIYRLFGEHAWPPPVVLVLLMTLPLTLRSAESRAGSGAHAVGQGLLHLGAVAQVGAALSLLRLPGVVGPAVLALAFYSWAGAADALQGGSSGRAVALEFGLLAVLGVAVALVFHGT